MTLPLWPEPLFSLAAELEATLGLGRLPRRNWWEENRAGAAWHLQPPGPEGPERFLGERILRLPPVSLR